MWPGVNETGTGRETGDAELVGRRVRGLACTASMLARSWLRANTVRASGCAINKDQQRIESLGFVLFTNKCVKDVTAPAVMTPLGRVSWSSVAASVLQA